VYPLKKNFLSVDKLIMYSLLKNRPSIIYAFLLLCGNACYAPVINAEQIWKCANNSYTSRSESSDQCKLLKASVICSTGGNKIISPYSDKFDTVGEKCPTSPHSRSPFINYELLENYTIESSSRRNTSGQIVERGTFSRGSDSGGALNQVKSWLEYVAATFNHISGVLLADDSD
jgi:hypothetical protein